MYNLESFLVPIPTRMKKNVGLTLNLSFILYPWIRIRIRNTDPDHRTQMNADPDPLPCINELFFPRGGIHLKGLQKLD